MSSEVELKVGDVVPGDIIKMKKPWVIVSEDTGRSDLLDTKSLTLKFGPRCELKVLQSTEDVITCQAFDIQNERLCAHVTVDFDPSKMDWDLVEVVKGERHE